ncbi:MAG: hypothetical protein K0Q53_132 [Massilibacillus sp.]|jgi:hypothetical protein|nr:hypothetical protein [Massilibacillus sp.]
MATYLEIDKFLEDNKLTRDEFDKIVSQVRKVNWKLDKILKDSGKHWSELNSHLLPQIIDFYIETSAC